MKARKPDSPESPQRADLEPSTAEQEQPLKAARLEVEALRAMLGLPRRQPSLPDPYEDLNPSDD